MLMMLRFAVGVGGVMKLIVGIANLYNTTEYTAKLNIISMDTKFIIKDNHLSIQISVCRCT